VNALEREVYPEIQQLHAEVARVLDAGEFARWPDFFTEDARYMVQSRENFERGWPLALIHLESRAMLHDRVIGATDTMFHDPYFQRHVVGAPVLLECSADAVHCEAAYLVMRTHRDRLPTVLSVGRYVDRLVRARDDGRWCLRERLCIYDNDLIDNSLIYPI
jgi:salicylate 5-hydroxylase small subunit